MESNERDNIPSREKRRERLNHGGVDVKSIYADELKNDGEEFSELKDSHVGAIIGIILLLLVVIGGVGYYFVIDSPKMIYKRIIEELVTVVDDGDDVGSYIIENEIKYNIDVGNGEYKEYQDIFNIINELKFNIEMGVDLDREFVNLGIKSVYKDMDILDISSMLETDKMGNLYVDLGNLYNKKIMIKMEDNTENVGDTIEEDYLTVIFSSLERILRDTMDLANYKKEYVKLDGKYVKKVTLYLDREFVNLFGTKMLNDEKLMEALVDVSEKSEDEIRDDINYIMDDDYSDCVNLYLSIFKNEFIKLDLENDEDNLMTIWKDDNKYNFEVMDEYTLMYRGFVLIDEEEYEGTIGIDLEIVPSDFTISVTNKVKLSEDVSVKKMDIADKIDYADMTDDDWNGIVSKFFDTEGVVKIIQDVGLDWLIDSEIGI